MVQQVYHLDCCSEDESEDYQIDSNESVDKCQRDPDTTTRYAPTINTQPILSEIQERKAPDKGWAWFVCLGGFLVHFIMGGFERSNGIIYLKLLSHFNRSATATAWVMSIFSTLRLVLGPVASALCNRFSCRFVVMVGSAICTLGILLSGFVTDISYMYVTYGILGGIGRALVYTPSVVAVGLYFNKRRGVAVGIATSGIGFGCFLFPPTIEKLFDHFGFSGAFLILTAVISNFFVCGALFRPLALQRKIMEVERKRIDEDIVTSNATDDISDSNTATKLINTELANEEQEVEMPQIFSKSKVSRDTALPSVTLSQGRKPLLDFILFKNFAFCALCIQLFLFTLSINISSLFLPALAQEKGVSNIERAYLVSIIGICDGICRIILSALLDLKRVKPYRLLIYNCVMFITAIVYVLLPSMTNFSQFAVICGLFDILSGTYMSQKSVVVVDVVGAKSLSSSFGFLMLAQGLSSLTGSTIGGLFKDFLGTYDMAFYFAAMGIIL